MSKSEKVKADSTGYMEKKSNDIDISMSLRRSFNDLISQRTYSNTSKPKHRTAAFEKCSSTLSFGGTSKPPAAAKKSLSKLSHVEWLANKKAQAVLAEQQKQQLKIDKIFELDERNMFDKLAFEMGAHLMKMRMKVPKFYAKSVASKPEKSEDKVKEWHAKKAAEAKEKIQKQRLAEQKAREQAANRKRQSEEAYQHWLSKSLNKAKPVPSKNDKASLSGMFTAQYWNPNEWEYTQETTAKKH